MRVDGQATFETDCFERKSVLKSPVVWVQGRPSRESRGLPKNAVRVDRLRPTTARFAIRKTIFVEQPRGNWKGSDAASPFHGPKGPALDLIGRRDFGGDLLAVLLFVGNRHLGARLESLDRHAFADHEAGAVFENESLRLGID